MAEWVTIPTFANGDIVRAGVFQDMWGNLQTLKSPLYMQNQLTNNANSWVTSSTTFADVDTTKLRHQFESSGGDILACVTIKYSHAAVNGSTLVRFELDGVGYGNSGGLARFQEDVLAVSSQCIYLFENVAAGSHTLDVQFATISGAASIQEDTCNRFFIQEY
jgi:hypothetical protein